ncbi:MAG: pyruvate carboxylase [Gammaproteobacteria bacterium]|nr:pyruvate carboxylase [Gammaproteobacteria bacterium]
MAHVEFLDETMRDGQQSLWGMRMTAGMALPVTPLIDRVGYRVVDLTGSSQFEVLIRECRENPWEGLDLLVQSMPRSKLRAGMRSNAAVTFSVTPDALMDAWIRQLNEHGCRSFWIYDVLFNIDKMHRLAKIAKAYGSEVAGTVMYTLSPVHSDEYFAEKAAQIAASPDIDTILLYDTAGVLDAERIKTLVPAIVARIGGRPLELHSNNRLGQSVQAYLAGIECGVNILHTSTRPLANGPAVPSIEVMARNVTRRGHTHDIDEKLLAPIADHFEKVGHAAGYLVNQFAEYDVLSVDHQIPGGMVGTLRAQLAKHGMSDKLEEVFEETAIVRRELGYPGMATPFSQLVGIQAVLNIVTGKRYSVVPDEVIQYAAGYYGQTVAPIEPDILDRIMAAPRAKDILAEPPEQPTIEELRKRYDVDNDDELILRALVPEADLARMRAAGPVKTSYPLLSTPELDQVARLMKLARSPVVEIAAAGYELKLRKL